MRRGSGIGLRFAEEKFKKFWRNFATEEEIELLEYVYGGAWAGMYPREGWENFVGFEPDSESYLEFFVSIYPDGEPHILARFLVPRDETKNEGYLIWNHYKGSTKFQEV